VIRLKYLTVLIIVMSETEYKQMSIYMEPAIIAAIREHVLKSTGSLRGMSPYCRAAIIEKLKADGVEIEE